MKNGDRKRFAAVLMGCAENYGKTISDSLADLWWEGLQRFDIGEVERAFHRHIFSPDTGQFMPKPADIIRMLDGTSIDASMVAWGKVDKAVRSIGPYASVTFDDPIIQRVLQDMGGWIQLGTKDDSEWPFVGNEFRTRYQGYRSRGETPDYPVQLAGIIAATNDARFPDAPREHALIGNEETAGRVALGGSTAPAVGVHRLTAAMPKMLRKLTGRSA